MAVARCWNWEIGGLLVSLGGLTDRHWNGAVEMPGQHLSDRDEESPGTSAQM